MLACGAGLRDGEVHMDEGLVQMEKGSSSHNGLLRPTDGVVMDPILAIVAFCPVAALFD